MRTLAKTRIPVCGQVGSHLANGRIPLVIVSQRSWEIHLRENFMGIRQLSQEEVADLRNNPYIVNATANKLRFNASGIAIAGFPREPAAHFRLPHHRRTAMSACDCAVAGAVPDSVLPCRRQFLRRRFPPGVESASSFAPDPPAECPVKSISPFSSLSFLSAGNAKKAGNLTFCGLDSRPLHVSGNTYFVRV